MNIASATGAYAADEIFKLNPADIRVGARIGMFWPEKAAALGALIAKEGQHEPIKVAQRDGEWWLIVGLHRLQGARGVGLQELSCIEVKGSKDVLRAIEASENLDRRDLEPIERALFVRARVDLAEKRAERSREGKSPQQRAAEKRWQMVRDNAVAPANQKIAAEAEYAESNVWTAHGWSAEVANSLGMSRAGLFDSLKIHRQLIAPFEAELWEELARTALGRKRKSLIELADIVDEGNRRLVIDTIVGDDAGEIGSVADAQVAAGIKSRAENPRKSGDTKWMDNAGSNLDRLSAAGWRHFAPAFVEKIKPSALIAYRDAIEARIAAEGGVPAIGGDDD